MRKFAFVFPGQGSQKTGMGRELAENFSEAHAVFEKADRILGFPLSKMCFEGPDEELRKTINTQPAILAASIASYEVLANNDMFPVITAGHSVGEYSALVAAGVLLVEDALRLVRIRGELMHEAGTSFPGSMAAIIGVDYRAIETACSNINGIVEIANFNSPEQIVISGEIEAVRKATDIFKEMGAKRVVPLNVGAAFHSSLMKSAAAKLALELDKVKFMNPRIPVVVNISGDALSNAREIREALKRQILGNVRWTDVIKTIISFGVDTIIEVGPGKALSGMIRKIDKYAQAYNIEDLKSFEKLRELTRNRVFH